MNSPLSTPTQPAVTSSLRVLVVDDSPTMRLALLRMLESLYPGCQVEQADDGKDALRSLSANRCDLILSDLEMPGMDGQSFVQLLKRNSVLRKKPVLVVSARLDDPSLQSLAGEPLLRFLAKPVQAQGLRDAVDGLLKAAQA